MIKAFPRVFELKITWNSSIQDISNIEILDYRIKVWDGSLLVQKQDAITGRSLVIKNLSRNKTYVIGIQARNEAGYGQMANITSRTILEGGVSLNCQNQSLSCSGKCHINLSVQKCTLQKNGKIYCHYFGKVMEILTNMTALAKLVKIKYKIY